MAKSAGRASRGFVGELEDPVRAGARWGGAGKEKRGDEQQVEIAPMLVEREDLAASSELYFWERMMVDGRREGFLARSEWC